MMSRGTGPDLVIYLALLCTIIITAANTDEVLRVRRQSDGWSDWQEESECSRSCGGGISYKERTCLNIGEDGRPQCSGPKKIYQSCNLQDCPEGSRDFRLEQCERYNDIEIEDKLHEWVPYYGGSNPCELNCLAKGQKFYYRHAAKVVDGTRCGPGTLDVCVDGICQPVGCDKVLGSNVTFDKCHECGGDGSSCKTLEGVVYTSGLRNGYNDAILIPAGATSITITEEEATNSYLALRDLQGRYWLNGDWRINLAHPKDIAGSVFHYHRGATPQTEPETIEAEGPTLEPLFLAILHQPGGDTSITYKYSVPKHVGQASTNTYSWEATEWSSCSQSCGGGTQTREVICHRTSDHERVGSDLCDHREKPDVTRTCIDNACPATWVGSEWSECSTSCGAGVQVRSVLCKQITSGGIVAIVHHKNCEGPRLESTQECNVDVKCPVWETGVWSRCNQMCGPGQRQRSIICRAQHKLVNATSDILPDWRCEGEDMPEAYEDCNEGPCEGLEWVTSEWSGCPSSCGITVETRHVICTSQSGVVFDSELCDPDVRPATTRPCPHNKTCNPDPQWHASQWSECSARCGPGFQHRRVVCARYVDGELDQVDFDQCDPDDRMPARQNCSGEDCVGIWFSGPWGKCSLACGGGIRKREVMCLSGKKPVNVAECDSNHRPDANEECNQDPCDDDNLLVVCKEEEFGCCPDGITAAEGPDFLGCPAKDRIPTGLCIETEYGCCLDGITPAQGPFSAGCPRFTCKDTLYGCCEDGQTPAGGPKGEECPKHFGCAVTAYGCCPDGFTPADGYKGEGCRRIEPPKPVLCYDTLYGCCPDGFTTATGPEFEGCDEEGSGQACEEHVHGCCADGETPAQGPNRQGCPEGPGDCNNDIYGCCPDGYSTALGPNFYGCHGVVVPPEESGCVYTIYGCCPDGEIAALGPNGQGCNEIVDADCMQSIYGCCQDGESVALGPNFAGCELSCENSYYGCCPDSHNPAQGPNFEGCDDSVVVVTCENTQYGCCPDGLTPARGHHYAGCNITQQESGCDATTYGCCMDGSTVAVGANFEGCEEEGSYELSCHDTPYGCCSDGYAAAEGPNNAGCPSFIALKDACSLPSDAGGCNNYSVQWFFDTLSGDCARFWYGGCDGNSNRYGTREECQQTCMEPQGIRKCYLPKSTGRCRANVPKFYYNVEERQCEQFTYGGCQGNNNKFDSAEECEKECVMPQQSSVCNQPHLTGPCRGNFPRWFYDEAQGQCQQFIYGGCKGNDNRFETLEHCQAKCQQPSSVVCSLPSDTGPCRGSLDAWFFNTESGQCEEFVYGGCRGNANRFSTQQDCENTCTDLMNKKEVDLCTLPKDVGPCRGFMQRWFYDQYDQRCHLFVYGGCQGNENRFETERECRQRCNAQPPEDMCVLPKDSGPCEAYYEQYHYDASLGRCEIFYYGGCEGNANRFATMTECEKACRHHITPAVTETPSTAGRCDQPKDAGPCVAYMPRWYHNTEEGSCQQFIYGGCQGNRNRFMSLEDCRENCMTDVTPTPTDGDVCLLPPEGGPCYAYFPSWYYDANEDRCHQFVYGGCDGNGNRFESEQDCERQCSKKGGSECAHHEFRCDDGQCIDGTRRCDRYDDCSDRSDEASCDASTTLVLVATTAASVTPGRKAGKCEWYEDQCDNGVCYDRRRRCDSYDDCGDGSDERNCAEDKSPCDWFEVQCASGQCIDERLVCNAVYDCNDGSDEENCAEDGDKSAEVESCDWYEVQCASGQCIDERLWCNSAYDCDDGSDEANCTVVPAAKTTTPETPDQKVGRCEWYEDQCDNGVCYDRRHRCDSYDDCGDGSDERNCADTKSPCDWYEVQCASGQCIDERLVCNSVYDCNDGSDEENCAEDGEKSTEAEACDWYEVQCASGQCIDEHLWCNLVYDCDDGSDEANCTAVPTSETTTPEMPGQKAGRCELYEDQCDNGVCYDRRRRCDSYDDCGDGSDERNCADAKSPCDWFEIQCASGQCIDERLVCNAVYDCNDGSDEENCAEGQACDWYEVQCASHQCLDEHLWYNPTYDCDDGSDEANCAVDGDKSAEVEACDWYEVQCASGQCIDKRLWCNSAYDCDDGSDEADCAVDETKSPDKACDWYEVQCASGQCIDERLWCNSAYDCDDGSDEADCAVDGTKSPDKSCDWYEVQCANGQCIDKRLWCNSAYDCDDGSDEADCAVAESKSPCDWYEVQCASGQCIDERLVCNSVYDCNDGSDEENCVEDGNMSSGMEACEWYEVQCASGQCIDERVWCNSAYDCDDGSDEADCAVDGTKSPNKACDWYEVQCASGQCIDERLWCNSAYDCDDGSDEADCAVEGCMSGPPDPPDTWFEVQCASGQCIDKRLWCNSAYDCDDGSDEPDCAVATPKQMVTDPVSASPNVRTCEWYESQCDNGTCYDNRRKCDSYADCEDGSDERNCGTTTKSTDVSTCQWYEMTCDNGRCIDERRRCDSYDDCGDGSDEAQCGGTTPSSEVSSCEWYEMACDNGRCVDERRRCDSFDDCGDGSDEAQCGDICALPQDTGECRAYIPSWYYDTSYQQCAQFVYGGCGGNANRFETAENCMAKCGGPNPVEPTDGTGSRAGICTLPAESGTCEAYIPSWYYDSSSQQCAQFVYGGCDGNANRFETVEECTAACAGQIIPPTEGPFTKTTTTDEPITGLAVCSLNNEHGPCREAYDRWFYDREEGKCLQFIYGGCRGNENNFNTMEECQAVCSVQDICYLPYESGSCSAAKTRFYYDSISGQCLDFTYSGCEGNANRFLTAKNCENVCVRNIQPPVVTPSHGSWTAEPDRSHNVCEMSHVTGPCRDWEIMWYYNPLDGGCGQFYYGGCDGNGNRFATLEECEARCVEAKTTPAPEPTTPFTGDVCTLPSDTGPCAEYEILWHFDTTDERCLQFWYGGCDGNPNRFASEDECMAQCSRDEGHVTESPDHRHHTSTHGHQTGEVTGICALSADPGQCDDYSVMWYFESTSMACRRFHYGGCDGNENRFATLEECEAACVYNQPESRTTPTHTSHTDHHVHPTEPTVTVEFDVCDAPLDIGDCEDKVGQWYYNAESGKCSAFTYTGCGGNGNRFESLERCELICVMHKWKDVCSFPPDSGSCPEVGEMTPHWFFNSNTGVCEAFLYSGCAGNGNRFHSSDECQLFCIEPTPSPTTPSPSWSAETAAPSDAATSPVAVFTPSGVCDMLLDSGPCRAWQPRWYYDAASNTCKDFIYGGCQGNTNNFISQEKCEYICKPRTSGVGQDVCTLPQSVGPCTAFTERWFYDQSAQRCLQFSYGGCQGNANNYMSEEDCQANCGSTGGDEGSPLDPREICMLPREQGPCYADMLRFNYDEETGECRPFIFGGCQGNANNFESQEDCYRMCGDPRREFKIRRPGDCFEKQDSGACKAALTRWFFDSTRGDCSPFYYGGCQGNSNNFHAYDDCLAMCSRVTDTCGVLTCDLQCPFGYESGNDGCPRCSCLDPCQNFVCPSNMECQVEQQICVVEPCPAPKPTCIPLPKPGECPVIDENLAGICIEQCREDVDCPETQKCCSNGCGRTCVDPSSPDPNQKEGSCPASIPPELDSVCLELCDHDMDCPENGKCCENECGHICLPPEATKTGCANSVFGCCLDGITPAGGYNFRGCPEEAPVIESEIPDDFLVVEGGRVLLPCSARGAPQPQITWYKDGFPILDMEEDAHVSQMEDGSLVMDPIRRNDGGVYTCRAYNGVGPPATRRYLVNLQVSLSFKDTPDIVNARPGETTRLVCSADGHPSPELRWLRNGADVLDGVHFIDGGYGVLLIIDAVAEDTGEYECEATNPFGEALRKPFQLNVVGPMSVEIGAHNTTWAAGDDLELECLVEGDGDIEVSWMKNDASIPEDNRIMVTPEGGLMINGIIKDDAGAYHCIAKRGDEEVSASTLIKVEGVKLPDDCQDKPWLANCDLIIKARLCDHKYFSDFCCLSCHQAGLLP